MSENKCRLKTEPAAGQHIEFSCFFIMTSTIFQKYCEKAIAKLSEEEVEKFKSTSRDDERIKMLYDIAKTVPVTTISNGKNFKQAQEEKIKGNNFFAKKNYEEALRRYNCGIIVCPQDSGMLFTGKIEMLTTLTLTRYQRRNKKECTQRLL